MITIHTGKFTYECKDYDAVLETIRRENINLDDARVSFRVSLLPATAFIGAQTNPTVIPDQFWIAEIEQEADRAGAKVFCKDSLASIPDTMFRRELCWQVRK